MKLILTITIVLFFPILLLSQNWFEGDVSIGDFNLTDFPSDYDLRIRRFAAAAENNVGIQILNLNPFGRSVLLAGEASYLGRYIYMSYYNPSYVLPETSSAFEADSGAIFTGGNNGLKIISSNGDITFTAGGTISDYNRMEIKTNGNIGIGTSEPVEKLQVANGDIYIEDIGNGVIMKSPDGQCWRYAPDNIGQLVGVLIPCPN